MGWGCIPTPGPTRGKRGSNGVAREQPSGLRTGACAHHCSRAFNTARSFDCWIAESARYRVKTFLSIPEKFDVLIDHLLPAITASANPPLTLSFSSASYFPLSCPTTIAKGFGWPSWGLGIEGMNSRLTRWLLERIVQSEKVRACVPMDFYRQEGWPGELLVLMNFLGEGKEDM